MELIRKLGGKKSFVIIPNNRGESLDFIGLMFLWTVQSLWARVKFRASASHWSEHHVQASDWSPHWHWHECVNVSTPRGDAPLSALYKQDAPPSCNQTSPLHSSQKIISEINSSRHSSPFSSHSAHPGSQPRLVVTRIISNHSRGKNWSAIIWQWYTAIRV